MKKNNSTLQTLIFGLIILSFIACETDFADLESDVINSEVATSYNIESQISDVITYTKNLGPVQTDNFGANLSTLGIYDDVFGRTTAGFVSQLTLSTYDPVFGDNPVIDSVVVTLPYFSVATGLDDDGNVTYDVDSILHTGESYKDIKLSIFKNDYFLRDFDPSGDFNENQAYFSNKSASASEMISNLEGEEINFVDFDNQTGLIMTDLGNNINIKINDNGYVLKDVENMDGDGNKLILETKPPGIRVMLDPNFWQTNIIDLQGDPVLSSQNSFTEYFRGLYFKAEPVDNDGSFILLNTSDSNANITIYYKKDAAEPTDTATFVLNFGPNKVNFFDNNFNLPTDTPNPITGDSRIYLKGGEGSIAGIKLFDGVDENGISNFQNFKDDFVVLNDDGKYESLRLINEANLVFYVDNDLVQDNEPNRLFLYDMDNKIPLIDYFSDATNTSLPSFSKLNHLGPLQNIDDNEENLGGKYKFRITEHIKNLLLRDSTNVELGLSVSLNVNLENSTTQREVQNINNFTVPASATVSPRGTILHGNSTENNSKRVYLEIYYTEPN